MPFERRVLDAVRRGDYDRAAVVTLVALEGSGYQRPGARMVVFADGRSFGSVTGGCLEKTIVEKTLAAIGTMAPLTFSVDTMSDGDAVFGYGLGCAGRLTLVVEPFVKGALPRALDAAFRAEVTRTPQPADIETLQPQPRLLLVGTGNDSLPIAELARAAGFEVTHVRRIEDGELALDARTAAVLVTHNVLADLEAARRLTAAALPYIGVVGSKKRFAWLREELQRDGLSVSALKGPAGLDIGAKTPAEIALSIVTEAAQAMMVEWPEGAVPAAGERVGIDRCSSS
jgi:xanthine dehydrogenase accessory factor